MFAHLVSLHFNLLMAAAAGNAGPSPVKGALNQIQIWTMGIGLGLAGIVGAAGWGLHAMGEHFASAGWGAQHMGKKNVYRAMGACAGIAALGTILKIAAHLGGLTTTH